MAIGTITEWDHTFDSSPGAGSQATGSHAYTADVVYVVSVTQSRTDSTEPPEPGLTGMGVTWTDLSGINYYWDSTPASMRKTNTFYGRPSSSGTGALTVTYATDPATIDIIVVAVPGAFAWGQFFDASHTIYTNSLVEPLTLVAPQSPDNAILVFVSANTNTAATARLELASDTGGDHNWTSFTAIGHASSPTGTFLAGYTTPADSDLTPGWYENAGYGAAAYLYAIEIRATPATAGIETMYCGVPAAFAPVELPSGVNFLIGTATEGSPHPDTSDDWETMMGGRHMQIGRRYDSGTATDITSSAAGNGTNEFSQDINVRHRAISMKETVANAGVSQASWETFIASIPVDGYITWITAHHEPDNDGGSHDATWFRTKIIEPMHAAWVAQGSRADVKLYVCFTVSNYSTAVSMFPASGLIGDFAMLLDPYDHGAGVMQTKCEAWVTAWKAAGGTSWGIGETGSQRTGTDQANWVTTSIQWVRSDPDAIIFLWWDDVGVDDWRLRSPANDEAIAAFAAQMDLTAV